jgi:uncharacterized protein YwqG
MEEPGWKIELRRQSLETRRMILEPGDPGPVPVTKVGGAPWWPAAASRPTCWQGHPLAFMAQVALADVPQLDPDPGLLSFHYCDECGRSGYVSFGGGEDEHRGYDVQVFRDPRALTPDRRGVVAPSSVPPRRVTLTAVDEIPDFEEIPAEIRAQIPRGSSISKDDFDENAYPGLVHVHRCKVGGWPSWRCSPAWPVCDRSGPMRFVGQLDWDLGRDTPWAPGGYAFLFACPATCLSRSAELVIQTT